MAKQGIRDWGLGIRDAVNADCATASGRPCPFIPRPLSLILSNPESPIPNPESPIPNP
jgi:hypothetical protein